MRLTSIFGMLGLANATTLLLPLYIWPGPGNPQNWASVFSALASYPTVSFTIIVNPDSGPGSSPGPDSDYAPALARLNSYQNARVIGYVHTSYGSQSASALNANVTHWQNWNNYAQTAGNQNTTISGIFFDETSTANSKVTYMNNAAAFAKSTLKPSGGATPYVVYNPGTSERQSYFNSNVNLIVQFEDTLANYDTDNPAAGIPPSEVSQTAFIGNTASGKASDVTKNVKSAKAQGFGGIYFSADCCYDSDLSLVSTAAAALV